MRVGLQWSQATPGDWQWIDVNRGQGLRRWRDLPKRPVPQGDEAIDNQPGYLFDVVVQGWCLRGADHIALEPGAGGVDVWRWFDDLEDDETDYRHGMVIRFRDGWVDRTLTFEDGSTIRHQGPDQSMTVYAEDVDAHRQWTPLECGGLPVELRPWSEWPAPPEAIVRHGVWLSTELLEKHVKAQRPVDWREWF